MIRSHRTTAPLSIAAIPARVARVVFATLRTWAVRRQTRRGLGQLDMHLLRDIGLGEDAARTEASKPFWAD